jgi:nucleoid-associated protein YgaU
MGFLDNVRDALRDVVSTQASKRDAGATKEDVAVDSPDSTTADDSAPPAPPTTGPVQPVDSVTPAPTEDAPQEREDAPAAKFETYTVQTGDTLAEIGARFGVSHLEIAKLNSIENPDLIFPGQVFRIPKN